MHLKDYPRATYRLQLNANFNFSDVDNLIDYFASLGISHLYLSPCLQATTGSTHGYDVVNHNLINAELGKKVDLALLSQRLKDRGMGIILDIVPNHMAIRGPENPWWWDVLENGQASRYSRYFDVDWHSDSEDRSNLILLPILGNHYGIVLENGELKIKHQNGRFTLNYYENVFPIAPRSLSIILDLAWQESEINELGYLAGAFEQLPHASSGEVEKIQRRHRDKAVLEQFLQSLCQNLRITRILDEAVTKINENFDLLDQLIGRQNYKLAFWKLSKYQIGYRRFFNINSLVGLRMEEEQVFKDSHRLIIDLANSRQIDGFRIDHPDGLYDPTSYFYRLRRECPESLIYAEKILEKNEELPSEWPISGTTGYDFLNLANGLFIDPEGQQRLKIHWENFTNRQIDYAELVYESKKKIIRDLLGSDINRLATDLTSICENHRRYRDFAGPQLFHALVDVAAGMSVYRTYIQPETGKLSEDEEKVIDTAIDFARKHNQDQDSYIFDFIKDILTLKLAGRQENEFIRRFQQFTGPVMAKSLEDTVFFIFNPLTCANEVGGNPNQPSTSPREFYSWCERISRRWPLTMLAGSTHDSKRSEDIRARIDLLSEIPEEWEQATNEWQAINKKNRCGKTHDANCEYLIYQTLFGCWPISLERLSAFIQKALREAKEQTCWFSPNEEFELGMQNFIRKILADDDFIYSFEKFLQPLIIPGRINSIAQLTLRLTAPGIPDIYQGNEVWNAALTDPDNRRPVDFAALQEILKTITKAKAKDLFHRIGEDIGQAKLFVSQKILDLRKTTNVFHEPDSFKSIEVNGKFAGHIIAYMRGENVAVVVPRLFMKVQNKWESTRISIPAGNWHDIFTGARVKPGKNKIKDILKDFPVAVLIRDGENDE